MTSIINNKNNTTSVTSKRYNKIKTLEDINYIIKWDNKRLQTKKQNIDRILEKKYTLQGNIQDIENELKRLKKEIKLKIKEKVDICKTIAKNELIFLKNKKVINRLNQLNKMEEEMILYQQNENENKLIPNPNNLDFDLNKINELPIELKRYIQEFFTYDTQCALLETKYKPFTIINHFTPYMLREIIQTIFNKEIDIYIYLNDIVKEKIINEYNLFYDYSIVKIKRNNYDERIFIKYIFIYFQYRFPRILNGLYKFIILLDKIKL
jgi:hypothetical protein